MKESIVSRQSTRTYVNEPLTQTDKNKILDYLATPSNLIGLSGNSIKIEYTEIGKDSDINKLSTYGVIKGAPSFAFAICKNTQEAMLDCGYVFEKFILFLETLNIGSCWLGGTFKRQEVTSLTKLKQDEFIPIISPIGYKAPKKSVTEKVMGRIVKARSRKDFDELFSYKRFGNPIQNADIRQLFEYVRLAPSASNEQPWRVIDDDDICHFYIERTPNYAKGKLNYDIQMIDIGIALCHYELAKGNVEFIIDDPHHTTVSPHRSYIISVKSPTK